MTVSDSEGVVRMSCSELRELPEYSCSYPTGTTIGKRWKRDENAYRIVHADDCTGRHTRFANGFRCECVSGREPRCGPCQRERAKPKRCKWVMGEYAVSDKPNEVRIIWRRILIRL